MDICWDVGAERNRARLKWQEYEKGDDNWCKQRIGKVLTKA